MWLPILALFWIIGTLIVHRLLGVWYLWAVRRGMRSGKNPEPELAAIPAPTGQVPVKFVRLKSEVDSALIARFVRRRTRRIVIHLIAGGSLVLLLAWIVLALISPVGISLERLCVLALMLGVTAVIQTLSLTLSRKGQLASAGVWMLSATAGFLLAVVHVIVVSLALTSAAAGHIPARIFVLAIQEVLAILAVGLVFWTLLQVREGIRRLLNFGPETLAISASWILVALFTSVIWRYGQYGERAWLLILSLPIYLAVLRAMFSIRTVTQEAPVELLYLRTFGPGRRSERFLRSLVRWWTDVGPVGLISGEDTANSTLSGTAALAMLTGSTNRLFVRTAAEARTRVQNRSMQPTADGTYSVTELLCTSETWQMVVVELMRSVAVVVIDLRTYHPENRGVAFEVRALAQVVSSPEKIIHIVDKLTDMQAIEGLLRESWSHRAKPVVLGIYELSEATGRTIKGLLTHLSRLRAQSSV